MRALALAVLLLSAVATAEPVVIGPESPAKSVTNEEWRPLYNAVRQRAQGLIERYRGEYDLDRRPLTPSEDQCLMNRLTRDEGAGLLKIVRRISNHPLVARLGGADRINTIVAAITHVLGGTDQDDWCNRPGPMGRNRGLSLYSESHAYSVPDARIADAVRAKVEEIGKARPLTWPEAVGIALTAAAWTASLAVP